MINAIVLAAGKSSRMKSEKIKVLHDLIDKPIIVYIADLLHELNVNNVSFVLGNQSDNVKKALQNYNAKFDIQEQQLGTANAVASAKSVFNEFDKLLAKDKENNITIIVMGDAPLIELDTLKILVNEVKTKDLVVATTKFDDAKRYGRIVRDGSYDLLGIVEFNDASDEVKNITEVNTGVYAIKTKYLKKYLAEIESVSLLGEQKFTDIVEYMLRDKLQVKAVFVKESGQFLSINDKSDLYLAKKYLCEKINTNHILNGVNIENIHNTYIGKDVVIEPDATVESNVKIYGSTLICKQTRIGSGSIIVNSAIEEGCEIVNSVVDGSDIGKFCKVGPFANLRKGTELKDNVKVGAYVEIKNSTLLKGAKAAHLSYLGDAIVGENTNIGCGVVTANYDGVNKHKTIIGNNSFIGCNVNLIAPITIGDNCVIAAGSTINLDVPDGDMAIARSQQVNKPQYGIMYFKNKRDKHKI